MQTLAELKALNAASEQAEATAEVEQVVADDVEEIIEADEPVESKDETEIEAETTSEEVEDWAKPEGSVPVAKHVEMKHKLKGKLHDVESENADLKARLAALETSRTVQPQGDADLKKPSRGDPDINYDEDLYEQKLANYIEAKIDRKLSNREQSQSTKSQQDQHERQVQSEVDKHYERAAALVSGGKVTEENYQAADHNVRKAVSGVLQNGLGDLVIDNMIARLGSGSEKVIYHLGVNSTALGELVNCFKSDPTGFAAAAYLGEKKALLNSAQPNKLSSAPKPDRVLNGTAKVGGGTDHKAYSKASSEGNAQAMISIKRAAKARGVDTSNW